MHVRRWLSTIRQEKVYLAFCPAQGAQYTGMLSKVDKNNKKIMDIVNSANEVLKTLYCQPAVALATIIAAEVLREKLSVENWRMGSLVGYSLGEVSALAVAGCISYEDAFKLIRERASAMEYASTLHPTGMLLLVGLNVVQVAHVCDDLSTNKGDSIYVSGSHSEEAVVLAGSRSLLNKVMDRHHPLLLHDKIEAKKLAVSGAFHTPYMRPAQERLRAILQNIHIQRRDIILYSNVTGVPYGESDDVRELLVRQIAEPLNMLPILRRVKRDWEASSIDRMFELSRLKQTKSTVGYFDKRLTDAIENIAV